ncbi:UNVERIFIED_CONTAM: hypothetical protein Scaly_2520200 [Sesamum calycinum]|uniref:Uncharacterized protein n=1 Tax=Sesamum calycinum TaxID=2727403 RepID=A0AAW2LVH6_9LAMI
MKEIRVNGKKDEFHFRFTETGYKNRPVSHLKQRLADAYSPDTIIVSSPGKEDSKLCLSPSVADYPLGPATDHRLGKLLPHQLANQKQVPPRADSSFCSSAYEVLAAVSNSRIRGESPLRNQSLPLLSGVLALPNKAAPFMSFFVISSSFPEVDQAEKNPHLLRRRSGISDVGPTLFESQ